jgi:hypothetical protein
MSSPDAHPDQHQDAGDLTLGDLDPDAGAYMLVFRPLVRAEGPGAVDAVIRLRGLLKVALLLQRYGPVVDSF